MRRSVAALSAAVAVVAILGGCNGREYLAVNGGGDRTALPAGEKAPPTPPPVQPAAEVTPAKDQCGAAALQYLVGKDKTEIPVALEPERRRVVCTTCPMTQDMRPDRQTILYDEQTKKVTAVRCG